MNRGSALRSRSLPIGTLFGRGSLKSIHLPSTKSTILQRTHAHCEHYSAMATPFKRICLRLSHLPRPSPRPFTTSTSAQQQQQPDALTSTDPNLDQLSRQSGVKYSLTTEPDTDLAKYNPADLSSLAHRELEQHRELREMVRLAAWEMPLLASLSKPYEQPRKEQVLRWRYTTYMGEAHPASRKVVVTFDPFRLEGGGDGGQGLSKEQVQKLLKLAGPRYNPTRRQIKLSCESFETPAQNKRYLADTIKNLIAEAKDSSADTFEDVPLDLRHHKRPVRHRFPEEWVMTKERQMQLKTARKTARMEEAKRIEGDGIVEGVRAIEAARAEEEAKGKVQQPVMAEARRQVTAGRGGRR